MTNASLRHELEVKARLEDLRKEGWRCVNLKGKVPDGIAVKGGRIVAVEVLRRVHSPKGKTKFQGGTTISQKKAAYSMFDDVLVYTFTEEIATKSGHRLGYLSRTMNILHPP